MKPDSKIRNRVLGLLLSLTLALLPGVAVGGKAGGGIGGTGIEGGGGGIGGTGRKIANGAGIGGTGIAGFGQIDAFGSVFVNGREYTIDARTAISVDGRPASEAALKLGDIVLVRGSGDPASRSAAAATIEVRHSVVGRIENIRDGGAVQTILGQTIKAAPGARVTESGGAALALSALRSGDTVAVSAIQRADGRWSATQFERRAPAGAVGGPAAFILEGTVTSVDRASRSVEIGGQTVHAEASAIEDGIAVGERVRAEGQYTSSGPVLSALNTAALDLGERGTHVEMRGFLGPEATSEDGRTVIVNGVSAVFGAPGDATPSTRTDRPVLIVGAVLQPGVIRVDTVGVSDIRPRDERSGTPDRGEREDSEEDRSDNSPSEAGEVENPEAEKPEVEDPETESPEVENPETESPEVENPEMESPEVESPEIEAPEVETPEVETPEIETPEVETPEIETPEIETPEIETPEVDN